MNKVIPIDSETSDIAIINFDHQINLFGTPPFNQNMQICKICLEE